MKQIADFSVYKSSAGSGKTYTLVREYLVMALQSPAYFKHILAITFTNKAANEMKQRILLGLKHLAEPTLYAETATVRFMLPDLAQRTSFTFNEISIRAAASLSHIIHEYDDFAVRTIDSFVSGIIRTFAHDLQLPMDFEIELDTELLLEEATENLIARVGLEKELTDVLIEYTRSKLDDEKSWRIDKEIAKTGKILFAEESFSYLELFRKITPEVTSKTASSIRKQRAALEYKVQKPAQDALDCILQNGIDHTSFYQGKNGLPSFLKKLAAGKVIEVPNYSRTTVNDDKWFGTKISHDQKDAIARIIPQLKLYADECFRIIDSGIERYKLLGMIQQNLYQVGMLSALEMEINSIKKEKNILHISEFNRRITEIILNEPIPFIYERTGEKYYNYLIDEFQDTSELQWKNLLPLLGNSLSGGHYNLIVGDGKQAIYRFRSGKVEQFVSLPGLPISFENEVFADTARAMSENYHQHILNSNFRSQPEIIRFNNQFFSFASNILSTTHRSVYDNHEQQVPSSKSGGYVSIDFLPYTSKAEFVESNLIRVSEIIETATADGISYGDIAILTRTNKDGNEIAKYLLSKGIPVVSAEALLLAGSPEVNFIVAWLSYLNNRNDKIAAATILNWLFTNKPQRHELIDCFTNLNTVSLEHVLFEYGIEMDYRLLLSLSLYDLSEAIIRLFGLHIGPYNVYLQFFLDFVNKMASNKGAHISDFLEAWDLKKENLSVVVPEGMDAVRIMSIHKSKGLEFPIVIWPIATSRFTTTLSTLWVNLPDSLLEDFSVTLLNTSKGMLDTGFADQYNSEYNLSLLDHLNIAYVACTRPAERLYIITREQKSATNSIEIQHLLRDFVQKDPDSWKRTERGFERGIASGLGEFIVSKDEEIDFTSFISTHWQKRIKIAQLTASSIVHDLAGEKRKWGNIIHETLSLIKNSSDFDGVIVNQVNKYSLSENETLVIKDRIFSTISNPQLSAFFTKDWELKSESAILTPSGNVFRPDRVLIKNNLAVLIEFKTGIPLPSHSKQLQLYADLLNEMSYQVIHKFLVYIDDQISINEIA